LVKRVAAITLGCAKNQVDTEYMLGMLPKSDYVIVSEPEDADAVVINTCCFIDEAKKETIDTLLQLVREKRKNPGLKLIAAGCLVQKYVQELFSEIPEIDGLMGTGQVDGLAAALEHVFAHAKERYVSVKDQGRATSDFGERRLITTAGPTSYLKIAEGCNNRCTYCVIPQIRGPYRSREIEALVSEAEQLVEAGAKEICLVAQDVTAYGLDLYGRLELPTLLKRLAVIDDLHWIRLLYCYPTNITRELIQVIQAEEKICKYLDIPLQHGDDGVLKRMGRKGNRLYLERLVNELRSSLPGVVLRTTFIVGFPGETEEEFQNLLDFMEKNRFHWAGAFTYSQEPGTPAEKMGDQVSPEIKEKRYHQLMLLQREITSQENEKWLGKIVPVMVERRPEGKDGLYQGRTEFQGPEVDGLVHFYAQADLCPGDFVQVKVLQVMEYDLVGEMVP
jgi:ribosomal protein S12 methylthiotransferase